MSKIYKDESFHHEQAIADLLKGKDQTGLCVPRDFRTINGSTVSTMDVYGGDLMDLAMYYINLGVYIPFDVYKPLLLQASSGLMSLHAAGVVHRDIKPENILVKTKPTPEAALCDYGTATFGTMKPNNSHHTLGYLPPESVVGLVPGAPGDVWAFGAMMLTAIGTHQLDTDGNRARLLRIHAQAALSPDGYKVRDIFKGTGTPSAVVETCIACMRVDPTRRITAEELYNKIKSW